MKNKNFEELLTSIGQARKIHAGKKADPYTFAEWEKIKKLSAENGKTFKDAKSLRSYLHKARSNSAGK
jgi:hypothetical protein